jgi:hypothetical protein
MVEVQDACHVKVLSACQLEKHMKERHRIGAARQGDGDTAARWEQTVSAHCAANGVDDTQDRAEGLGLRAEVKVEG